MEITRFFAAQKDNVNDRTKIVHYNITLRDCVKPQKNEWVLNSVNLYNH